MLDSGGRDWNADRIWASTPQNLDSEVRRQISRPIGLLQRLRRHGRHAYRRNNYKEPFYLEG